ncbi:hypothetical protein [Devosia chinhatensis]|uniref:hypothetical protein n=1 Tax=Devosia chinhatensis TaxID=429727 RepID=UPI000A7F7167|nr:hypothetical protein [Devosia chinhatensis]
MPTAVSKPRVVRANTPSDNGRHQPFGGRGSRASHQGWFYSSKLRQNVAYEGLDSFHFLCLAEVHPSVAYVSKEAEPLPWFDGFARRNYQPRYALALRGHRSEAHRIVDIEVLTSLQKAASHHRLRRLKNEAREAGRHLLIFTERTINIEPRLTNAKLIVHQAGEGLVTEEERSLVAQIADGTKQFTLNEIVGTAVLTYPRAYATVLNMVATGELQFSLGRLFDGDTILWRNVR